MKRNLIFSTNEKYLNLKQPTLFIGNWCLEDVSAKKLSGSDIVMMMVLPVLVSVIWTISGNILDSYPLNLEPFYPGILTSGLIYGLKVTRGKRN